MVTHIFDAQVGIGWTSYGDDGAGHTYFSVGYSQENPANPPANLEGTCVAKEAPTSATVPLEGMTACLSAPVKNSCLIAPDIYGYV